MKLNEDLILDQFESDDTLHDRNYWQEQFDFQYQSGFDRIEIEGLQYGLDQQDIHNLQAEYLNRVYELKISLEEKLVLRDLDIAEFCMEVFDLADDTLVDFLETKSEIFQMYSDVYALLPSEDLRKSFDQIKSYFSSIDTDQEKSIFLKLILKEINKYLLSNLMPLTDRKVQALIKVYNTLGKHMDLKETRFIYQGKMHTYISQSLIDFLLFNFDKLSSSLQVQMQTLRITQANTFTSSEYYEELNLDQKELIKIICDRNIISQSQYEKVLDKVRNFNTHETRYFSKIFNTYPVPSKHIFNILSLPFKDGAPCQLLARIVENYETEPFINYQYLSQFRKLTFRIKSLRSFGVKGLSRKTSPKNLNRILLNKSPKTINTFYLLSEISGVDFNILIKRFGNIRTSKDLYKVIMSEQEIKEESWSEYLFGSDKTKGPIIADLLKEPFKEFFDFTFRQNQENSERALEFLLLIRSHLNIEEISKMDLLTNYLNFISKSKSQDSDEKKLLYAFGNLEVGDLIITDPSFDMIQGLKNFSIFDELFEIYTSFKLKGKVDPIDDELYLQIIKTIDENFDVLLSDKIISDFEMSKLLNLLSQKSELLDIHKLNPNLQGFLRKFHYLLPVKLKEKVFDSATDDYNLFLKTPNIFEGTYRKPFEWQRDYDLKKGWQKLAKQIFQSHYVANTRDAYRDVFFLITSLQKMHTNDYSPLLKQPYVMNISDFQTNSLREVFQECSSLNQMSDSYRLQVFQYIFNLRRRIIVENGGKVPFPDFLKLKRINAIFKSEPLLFQRAFDSKVKLQELPTFLTDNKGKEVYRKIELGLMLKHAKVQAERVSSILNSKDAFNQSLVIFDETPFGVFMNQLKERKEIKTNDDFDILKQFLRCYHLIESFSDKLTAEDLIKGFQSFKQSYQSLKISTNSATRFLKQHGQDLHLKRKNVWSEFLIFKSFGQIKKYIESTNLYSPAHLSIILTHILVKTPSLRSFVKEWSLANINSQDKNVKFKASRLCIGIGLNIEEFNEIELKILFKSLRLPYEINPEVQSKILKLARKNKVIISHYFSLLIEYFNLQKEGYDDKYIFNQFSKGFETYQEYKEEDFFLKQTILHFHAPQTNVNMQTSRHLFDLDKFERVARLTSEEVIKDRKKDPLQMISKSKTDLTIMFAGHGSPDSIDFGKYTFEQFPEKLFKALKKRVKHIDKNIRTNILIGACFSRDIIENLQKRLHEDKETREFKFTIISTSGKSKTSDIIAHDAFNYLKSVSGSLKIRHFHEHIEPIFFALGAEDKDETVSDISTFIDGTHIH